MKHKPGFDLGDVYAHGEHRVPEGALVQEAAYCEGCPRTFLRVPGSRQRLCRSCAAKPRLGPESFRGESRGYRPYRVYRVH